jgi:hypothetical protein
MLLAALAFAALLDSGPPSQPQFLPSRIASSNGWELSIRPFDPNGLHGAEYVLRAPAEKPGVSWGADSTPRTIAWQGSRIWTLRDAVVSERGWTYGTAIVNHSPAPRRDPGTRYILALDTEGKARLEERFPDTRSAPSIGPPLPFEAANTVVVRAAFRGPHPSHHELWFYAIDGQKRATCEPFPLVTDENGYPTAYTDTTGVVAVRGQPLVLVHGFQNFSDRPYEWSGARDRWVVFDLDGKAVWSLDDAKDPAISDLGRSVDACRARKNSVSSTTPNEFEVVALRTQERVLYLVARDEAKQRWVVTEKSREPLQSAASAKK